MHTTQDVSFRRNAKKNPYGTYIWKKIGKITNFFFKGIEK